MFYRSVLSVSNGGPSNQKLTLKIYSLRIKLKAQNFASWMFSKYAFKIAFKRKKGKDFLIIVPLSIVNENGSASHDCFYYRFLNCSFIFCASSETQGLLAGTMRYFRVKVYFKSWRAPGNLFLPNQFQKWSNSVPLIFLPNQRGRLAG